MKLRFLYNNNKKFFLNIYIYIYVVVNANKKAKVFTRCYQEYNRVF